MVDAIIISDLHLGAPNCQSASLLNFIKNARTKKLILNGDSFDSLDFRTLTPTHWEILHEIRKMPTVWVTGNHDPIILSSLLNIEMKKHYIFESGGKRIMCLHGDIFDTFLTKHPWITWLADAVYNFLQKIDKSHYLARLAKKSSKCYLKCAERIKIEAIKYAKSFNCDFVCVGHSHKAANEIPYFNSGCWTEKPCSFLIVDNGVITLKQEFTEEIVELEAVMAIN
jgi:UDP-2,3-diacylglucosamine pyrophosphatase LpxH